MVLDPVRVSLTTLDQQSDPRLQLMPTQTLQIQRIASDHPVLRLSNGTIWQVPADLGQMLIQTWSEGNKVKLESNPQGEFTHRIENVASSASQGITSAKQIQEWPEEDDQ